MSEEKALTRHTAVLVWLALAALFSSIAYAGSGVWTSGGPFSPSFSAVQALAINPMDPSILYAARSGGFFKLTDSGGTWLAASTWLPGDASVSVVAIHPTDPSTLYAATSSGVFKSIDSGDNWAAANTGLPGVPPQVQALAINPADPSMIFAGISGGVYRSIDSGGTWVAANTGLPAGLGVWSLAINPVDPSRIFAGAHNGRVYRSIDSGATWVAAHTGLPVGGPGVTSLAINPMNPAILFAGTIGGLVYRSIDSGSNWVDASTGIPGGGAGVESLAINPMDPSTVYAGASHRGVYRSIDSGATWVAVNGGMWSQYARALAIDPENPSTLYAGTDGALFKSVDSGVTWVALARSYSNVSVNALAVNPSLRTTLFAGGPGGVYKSTDAGHSWAAANTGLTNLNVTSVAINPKNGSVVYAGTYGGVFRSIDSGVTWTNATNGGLTKQVDLLAIDPITPTTIYAAMRYGLGSIFRSNDSGLTWAYANAGLNSQVVNALAVDPTAPSTLYVAMGYWGVFKSTNSAGSWAPVNTGLPPDAGACPYNPYQCPQIYALAVSPATRSTVYAGVFGGITNEYHPWYSSGVYKTTDSGGTWVKTNTGLGSRTVLALAINTVTPATLYAGTGSGGVYKSVDSADTWTVVNEGLPAANVQALALDPTGATTLYAGLSGQGVWQITWGGGEGPLQCNWSLSSASANSGSSSGSATVTVTGLPAGCTGMWNAASNMPSWLSVSPASGASGGTATVQWAANQGPARTGSVLVGGVTFRVSQVGGSGLTVTKTGTGTGRVSSSPAGIDCGATCSAVFGPGAVVTLTAAADDGSTFSGWSGDCTGQGVCRVTLSQSRTVAANFGACYTIRAVASQADWGYAIVKSQGGCNNSGFPAGTAVSIAAGASSEYRFEYWSSSKCNLEDEYAVSTKCTMTGGNATVWAWFRLMFPQQGSKLVGTGAVAAAMQGSSVALSADGNTAIVGGPDDGPNESMAGAVWVWTRNGAAWSQQGLKLVGSDAVGYQSRGSAQGVSVSLSADGNTAIVGGPYDAPNGSVSGAAWVWTRTGEVWAQQGAKLVTPNVFDGQGRSVALAADGNTAIVGASKGPWGDTNGSASVWTRAGANWTQQGPKLVGSSPSYYIKNQGASVALSADGNTAIVGGPAGVNSTGGAWVWTRNGGAWTQQGAMWVPSWAEYEDFYGASVALSADGNTAMVGAPGHGGFNESDGRASMWTRSGNVWTEEDWVGSGRYWREGTSVALSADGSTAILGGVGRASIWVRRGNYWYFGTALEFQDALGDAEQGASVSVSADGKTAIVGGPWDDSRVGAAWVFARPAAGPAGETLAVTRIGTGTGTVTSGPAGINCGALCSAEFGTGTVVTLTAAADAGSSFAGWGGGCSGLGACQVTMSQARGITAAFTLNPQPLTVTRNGTGSGTVTSDPAGIDCGAACSASFAVGTVVTLTASPAAGSSFTGWSGGCPGADPCQVTMSQARGVTATFTANPQPLTVSSAGTGTGTVTSDPAGIDCGATCSGTFVAGTVVTLTASPDAGSNFTGWSGSCSGQSVCQVTMTQARAVTATFTLKPRTLTVTRKGTGIGTVTSDPPGIDCGAACSASFVAGTVVTLTASPLAGSSFTGWSGDCSGTEPCQVAMSQTRNVVATFSRAFHVRRNLSGTRQP